MKPYIALFGERGSGSDDAISLLKKSFPKHEVGGRYGCPYWWDKFSGWRQENSQLCHQGVRSIILVREPVSWMIAFLSERFSKHNLYFVDSGTKPFVAVAEPWSYVGFLWGSTKIASFDSARRLLDGPYTNLMDLRYDKFEKMRSGLGKDFIVIRYEDLLKDAGSTIKKISERFNIEPSAGSIEASTLNFSDKNKVQRLDYSQIDWLQNNIDWEKEAEIGYDHQIFDKWEDLG